MAFVQRAFAPEGPPPPPSIAQTAPPVPFDQAKPSGRQAGAAQTAAAALSGAAAPQSLLGSTTSQTGQKQLLGQ